MESSDEQRVGGRLLWSQIEQGRNQSERMDCDRVHSQVGSNALGNNWGLLIGWTYFEIFTMRMHRRKMFIKNYTLFLVMASLHKTFLFTGECNM